MNPHGAKSHASRPEVPTCHEFEPAEPLRSEGVVSTVKRKGTRWNFRLHLWPRYSPEAENLRERTLAKSKAASEFDPMAKDA